MWAAISAASWCDSACSAGDGSAAPAARWPKSAARPGRCRGGAASIPSMDCEPEEQIRLKLLASSQLLLQAVRFPNGGPWLLAGNLA